MTLRVELDLLGTVRHVGTLAWNRNEKAAAFQFSDDYRLAPLPLSPFQLKAQPGVIVADPRKFDGLHALFNDSLPDGWGRKLIDRLVTKAGGDYRGLLPIDRLAFVGKTGMGALTFQPARVSDQSASQDEILIDQLAAEAMAVDADLEDANSRIDLLAAAAGGSGGARPKILALHNPKSGDLRPMSYLGDRTGYEAWLIKFKSTSDPIDIGKSEYAYSLMAKAAGISMPETKLFKTPKHAYFAVRRFDLDANGRYHVQTASALAGVDHRVGGGFDYVDLLKLTTIITKNGTDTQEMFRRMAFNLFAHNRDDHAKNHAFVMNEKGIWRLAPAYDLTFSMGPGGEHNLAIAGEGANPKTEDLMRAIKSESIQHKRAVEIIDEVKAAIQNWPQFADQAGLTKRQAGQIGAVLDKIRV
jgi:serine/threonine-protein kinase HipA